MKLCSFPSCWCSCRVGAHIRLYRKAALLKIIILKKGSRLIPAIDPVGSTYMGKRWCLPKWVLASMYKSLLTESSPHCSQCKSNHSLYDHSFKSNPKPLIKQREKARKESPTAGRHMKRFLLWAVPWESCKPQKLIVLTQVRQWKCNGSQNFLQNPLKV